MKFTLIPDDNSVGVDGFSVQPIDLSPLGPDVHAVQWYGNWGEVEYKTKFENGVVVKPANLIITDAEPYAFAIAGFYAMKAVMDEASASQNQETSAPAATSAGN